MTLAELGRRAVFVSVAVVGAGAILGCAGVAGAAIYLTRPRRAHILEGTA